MLCVMLSMNACFALSWSSFAQEVHGSAVGWYDQDMHIHWGTPPPIAAPGTAYRNTGAESKAELERRKAATSVALNDKGKKCYDAGDFESAVDYFRAALKLAPNDEAIQTNLKTALARHELDQQARRDERTVAAIKADIENLRKELPRDPPPPLQFAPRVTGLGLAPAEPPKLAFENSSAFGQAVAAERHGHYATKLLEGHALADPTGEVSRAANPPDLRLNGTSFFGQSANAPSILGLNDAAAHALNSASKPWDTAASHQGLPAPVPVDGSRQTDVAAVPPGLESNAASTLG